MAPDAPLPISPKNDKTISQLADLHTRTVQAWLSSRSPAAEHFKGNGVAVCSTGLQVALLNLALGGEYPAEASDAEIGAEIEQIKAFFARRGVPWYWWLGPNVSPTHLGKLLEQHGLQFDPPGLPAMVATLPVQFPPTSPDIQVWQAETLADLQSASAIRRLAFRFPEGVALEYFDAMAENWLQGDPAQLYLAGSDRGHPWAIGALIHGAGIPGIYVMATLPGKSRQGFGKAILTALLSQAQKDGHKIVVLTASRFGYPLYRQFGFEHIFDYAIYRPTWI